MDSKSLAATLTKNLGGGCHGKPLQFGSESVPRSPRCGQPAHQSCFFSSRPRISGLRVRLDAALHVGQFLFGLAVLHVRCSSWFFRSARCLFKQNLEEQPPVALFQDRSTSVACTGWPDRLAITSAAKFFPSLGRDTGGHPANVWQVPAGSLRLRQHANQPPFTGLAAPYQFGAL